VSESKRCYRQFCGLARALDYLGERWTLLIVRDLLLAPRRYSDLLSILPGMTSNMLASRLKQMEQDGIIERQRLARPSTALVYRLTPLGLDLEKLVDCATQWGERFLTTPGEDEHVDFGWVMPRLKSRYRGGYQFPIELRVDERRFILDLQPDALRIRERDCPDAELIITGELANIYELFFGPAQASEVVARGDLVVEGKFGRWPKMLAAFGLR
jgi:DNA-binding HxlR family transcriptional regulator